MHANLGSTAQKYLACFEKRGIAIIGQLYNAGIAVVAAVVRVGRARLVVGESGEVAVRPAQVVLQRALDVVEQCCLPRTPLCTSTVAKDVLGDALLAVHVRQLPLDLRFNLVIGKWLGDQCGRRQSC